MYRKLISLAAAAALFAAFASTALAASPTPNASTADKCPAFVDGQGGYYYTLYSLPSPTIRFTVSLGNLTTGALVPGCKNTTYQLTFLPTDANGVVLSTTPTYQTSWKGDGKTAEYPFSIPLSTATAPAGVCVYATATQGGKVTHYAPTTTAQPACNVLLLDASNGGGTPFRG